MSITRIYSVVLRHFYNLRRSFDRMSDVFYWPALDILLWGITGLYFISLAPDSSIHITAIIGAILLWVMPWRAQNEISINVLTELWDRNLGNIFISPLKFSEWAVGLMILGIAKGIISVAFTGVLAYLLYGVNIFMYGWYLIIFGLLLSMFGWAIGFAVAAVVMRFGSRIQTLGWTVPWAAAPLSAIYFPVSILPEWFQIVAKAFPSSYVFETSRQLVFEGVVNWNFLAISFVLNIVYLTLALLLFRWSFKKALMNGIHNLH